MGIGEWKKMKSACLFRMNEQQVLGTETVRTAERYNKNKQSRLLKRSWLFYTNLPYWSSLETSCPHKPKSRDHVIKSWSVDYDLIALSETTLGELKESRSQHGYRTESSGVPSGETKHLPLAPYFMYGSFFRKGLHSCHFLLSLIGCHSMIPSANVYQRTEFVQSISGCHLGWRIVNSQFIVLSVMCFKAQPFSTWG